MKFSSLMLSVFMTGLFSSFAGAHGGSAEGGGNTQVALSTTEQVSKAIDLAKEKFVKEMKLGTGSLGSMTQDPDLSSRYFARAGQPARILEIMDLLSARAKAKNSFLANLIDEVVEKTKIEKRTSGSCGPDQHLEGFVQMNDPHSPICFNVQLLQRIPSGILKAQVLALMAHEYMHKLGFQEADAHLIQMYFLAEVSTGLADSRLNFGVYMGVVRDVNRRAKADIQRGEFRMLCSNLRTADGFEKMATDAIAEIYKDGENLGVSTEKMALAQKVMDAYQKVKVSLPELKESNEFQESTERLTISEAFCMGRYSEKQVSEYLGKLDPLYQPMIEMTTTIFPPALTVKK